MVWNLTKAKQTHVFLEHDRTVNRVRYVYHYMHFQKTRQVIFLHLIFGQLFCILETYDWLTAASKI